MTREYIASANTVEEAIAIACEELGVSQDECSTEVLQLPKKGLFGKIKQQAKVKVLAETVSVQDLMGSVPSASEKRMESKPAPAPAPKQAAPKKEEKPAAPAEVKKPAPVVEKAPPKEPEQPQGSNSSSEAAAPSAEEIAEVAPKIQLARDYLHEIFEKMGIEGISTTFTQTEGRTVVVYMDGDAIGTVIGKRGETLDAIQYLVCLAANRLEGEYVRFTMNAGNYREKREETLKALAQRMAKKVLKTGRPAALEPMNPYERRIIHAVITDIDGVFSKSTGEEPNRKVVIKPTSRSDSYRGERSGRGGDKRRSGKGGYEGRRSAPEGAADKPAAPSAPKEAKKIDDDVKLYSKIEIE